MGVAHLNSVILWLALLSVSHLVVQQLTCFSNVVNLKEMWCYKSHDKTTRPDDTFFLILHVDMVTLLCEVAIDLLNGMSFMSEDISRNIASTYV